MHIVLANQPPAAPRTIFRWFVATFLCLWVAQPSIARAGEKTLVVGLLPASSADNLEVVKRLEAKVQQAVKETAGSIPLAALTAFLFGAPHSPARGLHGKLSPTALRDMREESDDKAAIKVCRQAQTAFDTTARPSRSSRKLMAEILHEWATRVVWSKGKSTTAQNIARKAWRRFPQHSPDTNRISDRIMQSLFVPAQNATRKAERGAVEVRGRGTVYIDGGPVAEISKSNDQTITHVELPVGHYRLWLVGEAKQGKPRQWMSLPRNIEIVGGPTAQRTVEVKFDLPLEGCLHWDEAPLFICGVQQAKAVFGPLAAKLGFTSVMFVDRGGSSKRIRMHKPTALSPTPGPPTPIDGNTGLQLQPGYKTLLPEYHLPRFRAWYLLPLGGGQLAQDRPEFAIAYAVGGLGLLGWNLLAARETESCNPSKNEKKCGSFIRTQNRVAGVFAGYLLLTVVEAIVYGQLVGDH